ncbi:hypothetical protein JCM33374_g971 [Metschnikowia sp. JCM 33374]|nr:hypothetical protein JCM33374_g971 [Metschnikowia sp. JCM 33374]
MTLLCVDPAALPLFYPRASSAKPQKLRVIAQVVDYDYASALLSIRRLPNLNALHTQIDLEETDSGNHEEVSVPVDLTHTTLASRAPRDFSPGAIVSIIGYYNGSVINGVECFSVDEQALLGASVDTLAAMATLGNL